MAEQDEVRFGLRPTLIVGLGGTGHEVLVRLKARYLDAYGDEVFRIIKLLCFDTADEAKDALREDATIVQLDRGPELSHIGNVPTQRILKNLDNHPTIKKWLPANMPSQAITAGAQQVRPMGRLAFFHHFPSIKQKLDQAIRALCNIRQRGNVGELGEIVRSQGVNVFIITSVCGGTGSGIFLDMAYVLRQLCMDQGLDENYCHINAVLALPQAFATVSGDGIRANAYAAFSELDYFTKNGGFEVDYPSGVGAKSKIRPFNICYFVDGVNEQGKMLAGMNELAPMIAEAVFLQTASQVGESQKSTFDNVKSLSGMDKDFPTAYSGFGTATLSFPVQILTDACAARYCDNLLRHHILGRATTPKAINDEIEAVVEKMRLSPDGLRLELGKDDKGRVVRINLDVKSLEGVSDQELVGKATALFQNEEDKRLNQLYHQFVEANYNRLRGEMARVLNEETSRIVDDRELGLDLAIAFLRQIDRRIVEIVEKFTLEKQAMQVKADNLDRNSGKVRDDLGTAINSFFMMRGGRITQAKETFIGHHKTRLEALFERNLRSSGLSLLAYLSDDVVRVRLRDLETLKDKLQAAQSKLSELADELANGRSRALSPLTYEITDAQDVNKYYNNYVRDLTQELPRLFEENGELHAWNGRSYDEVYQRLLNFGRSVFVGIRQVDIEQVVMDKRDRATPEVRLEELRDDSMPFWNRDLTRMEDGGTFIETITVIGVRDKSQTIYSEVREGEMLASTHNRHATTVLTTRHGITIYALQQYEDYKRRYERYRERQTAPLHCFDISNTRWIKTMFAVGQAFSYVKQDKNRFFIDFPAEYETLKEVAELGHGLTKALEKFIITIDYPKRVEQLINQYIRDQSTQTVEKMLDAYINAEFYKSAELQDTEKELKQLVLEYKTKHLNLVKPMRREQVEVEAKQDMARKLLAKGDKVEDVAEITGLPLKEVQALAEAQQASGASKSMDIARKLLAKGDKVEDVAEITGLSLKEVKSLAEAQQSSGANKSIDIARKLLAKGDKVEDVAEITGLSLKEVKSLVQQITNVTDIPAEELKTLK